MRGPAWGAPIERIVTWARLRDAGSGNVLFHFNTHFECNLEHVHSESAELLLSKTEKIAGREPLVVTGDFNFTPDCAAYRILTREGVLLDARAESRHPHHGPTGTFTGFTSREREAVLIDYIFVRNAVVVLAHGVLADTFDGLRPSDHRPVLAEVVVR